MYSLTCTACTEVEATRRSVLPCPAEENQRPLQKIHPPFWWLGYIRYIHAYPIIAIRFHTWRTHTEYQQVMTLLCHQSYSKPKDVAWTGRMEILTKSCACTLGASEIPFTWGKAQNYHTQEQSSDTLDMGSTPKRDQFSVSVPTSFWSAVNERKKTHAIARSWSSRIRKMPSTCRYFP
jgi:hypothetical protein